MNIVIFGAGAIGSLFGALLSKNNSVVLVGRGPHISCIQENGLTVKGKTRLSVTVPAVESTKDISFTPDLILLTVKSYDTETASKQILNIIQDETMVLSLQNGLDNIERIEQIIEKNHILAGVSTHGTIFSKPGEITHTGKGKTILGELDGHQSKRLESIVHIFNEAGIDTQMSEDIVKEIWIKAIINSSINPLTAFFGCKNGYLLDNPLLEKIVECVCMESSLIASSEGITLSPSEMIEKTKEVIRDTALNYSSMLQSIQQGKKTEIDSMNGTLVRIGVDRHIDAPLNEILTQLITSLGSS
ncbi:MAG TPA: 2-dehydropantoate 2-reductase [Thermoplasmata archaeon]|jgi:2-dehydropantoate 2-reductase|nr:MAG TPA: 2-dehydropantoate 2-reductase [Thermoplasmata archaeon]